MATTYTKAPSINIPLNDIEHMEYECDCLNRGLQPGEGKLYPWDGSPLICESCQHHECWYWQQAFSASQRPCEVKYFGIPFEKLVQVSVEVPVEKTVEVSVDVPVEISVEVPVQVYVEVPVEKIVQVPVEVSVEVPVEKIVEKTVEVSVEVPVEKIVERVVEVSVEVPIEKIVVDELDEEKVQLLSSLIERSTQIHETVVQTSQSVSTIENTTNILSNAIDFKNKAIRIINA